MRDRRLSGTRVVDAEQLSLDGLEDEEPEDWDEWFKSLPRTPGDPASKPDEEDPAA